MLMADQSGQLKIITDFREATDVSGAITDIVYNGLTNSYTSPNFGSRALPDVINLYNSDKPAIILGNITGGIQILRNDDGESLPDNPRVRVYPVPAAQSEDLSIWVDRPATMEMYSSLGQIVHEPMMLNANKTYPFGLESFAKGVYILRFTTSTKKTTVRRIVVY
jgi:hypothetical protein